MQRRKFLQYAAASGLGILGAGYLYKYAANAKIVRTPAGATPLFIPGNSGPLGILDMSDAPITLNAHAATLPLIQGKPSPFLIYATQYGGKVYQNPIIRVKRGSNEKFWAYLDHLYEITPSNNNLDPAELPRIAEYVGLNRAKFEQCLQSGKYAQRVAEDLADALAVDGQGRPIPSSSHRTAACSPSSARSRMPR